MYIQGKWMLTKHIFNTASLYLNFTPTIDLFASRINNQIPVYVSYKPDPDASSTDVFTLDWSNLSFYDFLLLAASVDVYRK